MNTPTEPEGGSKKSDDTTIVILNNAGKPWQGSYIEHNGKRYDADKEGKVKLHINGGALYANRVAVKIGARVSEIFLRYNNWNGSFMIIENPTSGDNTPLPHPVGSRAS